jgi:hypothetical protein
MTRGRANRGSGIVVTNATILEDQLASLCTVLEGSKKGSVLWARATSSRHKDTFKEKADAVIALLREIKKDAVAYSDGNVMEAVRKTEEVLVSVGNGTQNTGAAVAIVDYFAAGKDIARITMLTNADCMEAVAHAILWRRKLNVQ